MTNNIKDAVIVAFKDIKDMKRPEYKEKFEGKKLIYIYHNAIDARGDHAATEIEVFDAVEKTDNATLSEEFVSVPEQGGSKLIPEGMNKAGHIYTVGHGDSGMIGVYN